MSVDIAAIRRRNERRVESWKPAVGETVMFVSTQRDETLTVTLADIRHSSCHGRWYIVEQHVRFADYQITDVRDSAVAMTDIHEPVRTYRQELRLYALDANIEDGAHPEVEGFVTKVYAKHGDLFGHISYEVYAEDWGSITLVDPSAREDIGALIQEVEELRAQLLAS